MNGELPSNIEALTALPGIGRYTAGAILSFAFHEDVPIVDTNIRRIIQRIFGIPNALTNTAVRKQIWQVAEKLLPPGKGPIFNEALMDFGALICTARRPACSRCFAKGICRQISREHPLVTTTKCSH